MLVQLSTCEHLNVFGEDLQFGESYILILISTYFLKIQPSQLQCVVYN